MPPDNVVQVVLNGESYDGWLEVDLDSDILLPADGFNLTCIIPKQATQSAGVRAGKQATALDKFREGEKLDIYVGNTRQMAGVIDRVRFSGDRSQSRMTVTGRDLAAYLVDCEAKSLRVSKNYTVKKLIESLLDRSYGIKEVIFSNQENRTLVRGRKDKSKKGGESYIFANPPRASSTKIDPGQTIAHILDTHTKRLGITWWLTADGKLFLGKPNYSQPKAYSFYFGAENANATTNIESYEVEYSIDGRYSELQVNGQGNASKGGLFDTGSGKPRYKGVARDADLESRGITRKIIIADSDVTSGAEAQKRAEIEQGQRQLKGFVLRLTVPDFGQVNEKGSFALYAVDTIAAVRIEELGIDGTYYVTQRRFRESRSKRRTELTLHEKDVWLS